MYTVVMINYVLIGCLDIEFNLLSTVTFIGLFIYAQTILYDEPLRQVLAWNVPQALNLLLALVLCHVVYIKFLASKVREQWLESAHEDFVDNLKEGLIINPLHSNQIKIFNKAALKLFRHPEQSLSF